MTLKAQDRLLTALLVALTISTIAWCYHYGRVETKQAIQWHDAILIGQVVR